MTRWDQFLYNTLRLLAVSNSIAVLALPVASVDGFENGTPTLPLTNASSWDSQPANATLMDNPTRFMNGGYWPEWKENLDSSCLDVRTVTHVNYAFAEIDDDGALSLPNDAGLKAWMEKRMAYPHLQILLAVGGGHDLAIDRSAAAASDTTKLERLVESAKDIVTQYDLDGLDIDWEVSHVFSERYQLKDDCFCADLRLYMP